jgi:hypothetical protein
VKLLQQGGAYKNASIAQDCMKNNKGICFHI